ncbi:hypothetical protein BGW80DRAFT_261686 [Lactifluus volemus]|nr:hypothetical protein BGW80DRAFT_261686 [Lactifluus volemus]
MFRTNKGLRFSRFVQYCLQEKKRCLIACYHLRSRGATSICSLHPGEKNDVSQVSFAFAFVNDSNDAWRPGRRKKSCDIRSIMTEVQWVSELRVYPITYHKGPLYYRSSGLPGISILHTIPERHYLVSRLRASGVAGNKFIPRAGLVQCACCPKNAFGKPISQVIRWHLQ